MTLPVASVSHTLPLFTIPNFGALLRPRFLRQESAFGRGENLSGLAERSAQRTPKSSSPDDSRSRFSKKGMTARSLGENAWLAARQGRFPFGLYLVGSLIHASSPNNPAARLLSVSRNSGVSGSSNWVDMIVVSPSRVNIATA